MAIQGIFYKGKVIIKPELGLLETQIKGTFTKLWSNSKPFLIDKLNAIFLKWVLCNNITLQKGVSNNLRNMFALLDSLALKVFPILHNTIRQYIT